MTLSNGILKMFRYNINIPLIWHSISKFRFQFKCNQTKKTDELMLDVWQLTNELNGKWLIYLKYLCYLINDSDYLVFCVLCGFISFCFVCLRHMFLWAPGFIPGFSWDPCCWSFYIFSVCVCLRLVCPMFPVSLACPFGFSNV